jgi:hypothetical protein
MLQNFATIPLYITHKNVTFCHEGTCVQKGFLVAACLLACSLFKHPLLSVVLTAAILDELDAEMIVYNDPANPKKR